MGYTTSKHHLFVQVKSPFASNFGFGSVVECEDLSNIAVCSVKSMQSRRMVKFCFFHLKTKPRRMDLYIVALMKKTNNLDT